MKNFSFILASFNVDIKVIYSFSNKVFMWIDCINLKIIMLMPQEKFYG
jgi:hypothetical protein